MASDSKTTGGALGTDPSRGGEEVLRRFAIGSDGVPDLDDHLPRR
ncbi:hypothetical protein [Nocardia sp. NPDC059691]